MGTPGKLYLVATPLGNLEDITRRALRILEEVDLIAAEDTRRTLKLLNYFGIKKSLISFFQHNEKERGQVLLERLLAGQNIALVSDAGMPGISDPGTDLVMTAVVAGIGVVPIPGPTAVITALAASGLPTGSFRFEGFLPRKKKEQVEILQEIAGYAGTIVFYEAPHRLQGTLENIREVLGDRKAVLARELTKIHEEFIRGTITEILDILGPDKLKGEFTIVVEGQSGVIVKNRQNLVNVESKETSGSLRKELRALAARTGLSTKEVYRRYLEERDSKQEEAGTK